MSSEETINNIRESEALPAKFEELGILLHNIKNDFDKYRAHFSASNDLKTVERLAILEKDMEQLNNDFKELKSLLNRYDEKTKDIAIQYQELVGSINQLKLSIDEINQRYISEKEEKRNIVWQLLIPILLAIVFFIFGIFYKSFSSIHTKNVNGNNGSEYINFETNK